nr:MAG TPA: hypothetical protein [Caudoviricetes sp.]
MLLLCNEENKKVWKICYFLKRAFFTYDKTAKLIDISGFYEERTRQFSLGVDEGVKTGVFL